MILGDTSISKGLHYSIPIFCIIYSDCASNRIGYSQEESVMSAYSLHQFSKECKLTPSKNSLQMINHFLQENNTSEENKERNGNIHAWFHSKYSSSLCIDPLEATNIYQLPLRLKLLHQKSQTNFKKLNSDYESNWTIKIT